MAAAEPSAGRGCFRDVFALQYPFGFRSKEPLSILVLAASNVRIYILHYLLRQLKACFVSHSQIFGSLQVCLFLLRGKTDGT